MYNYFIKKLKICRDFFDEIEAYLSGIEKAANSLENDSSEAAYYFDKKNNTYVILDQSNPDIIMNQIIERQNKGATTIEAKPREEEKLPKLKEGSIRKRIDGRWEGRFYSFGKRIYLYSHTKLDIINQMNTAIKFRNKQNQENQIRESTSLKKWIQEWLRLYKSDLKPASMNDYRFNLVKKANEHEIGKKAVGNIFSIDIDKFLLTIKSPVSKHRTYILLKACFNKLKQNRLIRENPFDFVKIIRKPKPETKNIPNKNTLDRFFRHLQKVDRYIYVMAKFISLTGLRKGEALALRWEDIREDRIHISRAFNSITGEITSPKSYSSKRNIPLFPEAKRIIDEEEKKESIIFCKVSVWQSGRKFSDIASNYGLKNLTLHVLRHYFATQCLNAGISDKVTASWLGHANSTISKEVYQHVQTEFETKEIEKLSKYRAIKE
jgi:integrase